MGIEIQPNGLTKVHLVNANIPCDYWECNFSNFQGDLKAVAKTAAYLAKLGDMKEKGVGLIYVGPHGVGKTTLGMIVMKYLVRARWDVYCTSLGEIVETIQRSWKNEEEYDLIGRAREAAFLFIDDIGKEHKGQSGFVQRVFDNLIRHRVQHRLPTIITSNYTRSELEADYGESIISLFDGKLMPVVVDGDDHRRTVLKQSTRGAIK